MQIESCLFPTEISGDYLATKTDKEIVSWDGFCPTHQ